jgi:uncharacterized membrane protein
MGLVGKLHPMLVHFPIGLILGAAAAEITAILTRRAGWRTIAVANVRAGAAMGAVTAVAGWVLATAPLMEHTQLLTWHRWVGIAGATGAIAAALASIRSAGASPRWLVAYQASLFAAAALVALAGHLGGLLVWGDDFFRQ